MEWRAGSPKMSSVCCPHCKAPLLPGLTDREVAQLSGAVRGAKPRPGAVGKKRPGVGGRPKAAPSPEIAKALKILELP